MVEVASELKGLASLANAQAVLRETLPLKTRSQGGCLRLKLLDLRGLGSAGLRILLVGDLEHLFVRTAFSSKIRIHIIRQGVG